MGRQTGGKNIVLFVIKLQINRAIPICLYIQKLSHEPYCSLSYGNLNLNSVYIVFINSLGVQNLKRTL